MSPARLHVILARDAASGVVIRRGPSPKVCVIGWNRENDTFAIGQWLYGRIYEGRCDLSPDGRLFVYFAMNGRWQSEVLGAWTAVSRAPYLHAIGLWPKGDCWNGGGLFLSNRELWLNDGYGHRELRDDTKLRVRRDAPFPAVYGGECPSVYYHRLQRDGWTLTAREPDGAGGRVTHFHKRISDQWTLVKHARETAQPPPGRGCYYDEHSLVKKGESGLVRRGEWEWADVDGERLVWAEAGCLLAARVGARGLGKSRVLFDFNPLTYARLQAPY